MPFKKGQSLYALQAAAAATSPGDNTTTYMGTPMGAAFGSVNNQRIYIPKSGIIKAVFLNYAVTTVIGTSETATVSLRLNDTTDTQISNAVTLDAAQKAFNNTALNIPVAAGDFFELKQVWPNWATNPTGVRGNATILIQSF